MVSAENEEVLRILDFVGEEKTDCFQRLLPTVHIVTGKDGVGR